MNVQRALSVLGYRKDFNLDLVDLKKRYRSQAKVLHPDVTGDEKRFMELQDAYEYILDNFQNGEHISFNRVSSKEVLIRCFESPFNYVLRDGKVWKAL